MVSPEHPTYTHTQSLSLPILSGLVSGSIIVWARCSGFWIYHQTAEGQTVGCSHSTLVLSVPLLHTLSQMSVSHTHTVAFKGREKIKTGGGVMERETLWTRMVTAENIGKWGWEKRSWAQFQPSANLNVWMFYWCSVSLLGEIWGNSCRIETASNSIRLTALKMSITYQSQC